MQLIENFDLSAHNTMRLRSVARYGATITQTGQVPFLADLASEMGLTLHILGRGSNCLLREDVDAIVALMAIRGKFVHDRGNGAFLVTARAGEDWPAFVEWTVEKGLGGLENLAGIPGTVGAAPVQNIGAYGVELEHRLHSLTAYDTVEGRFRIFEPADCEFAYRTSIFKKAAPRYIIVDVTFALSKDRQPALHYPGLADTPAVADAASVMNRVLALRRSKLPDWRLLGNAGSFFHNPIVPAAVARRIADAPGHRLDDEKVKLPAAWLIEACGLKGFRRGPAGIYDKHALIVVNYGGATYEDISDVAATVAEAVRRDWGLELVREPVDI